jgi:hypothetical protein
MGSHFSAVTLHANANANAKRRHSLPIAKGNAASKQNNRASWGYLPDQSELLVLKDALVGNHQASRSEDLPSKRNRIRINHQQGTNHTPPPPPVPPVAAYLARSCQARKIWYAVYQRCHYNHFLLALLDRLRGVQSCF